VGPQNRVKTKNKSEILSHIQTHWKSLFEKTWDLERLGLHSHQQNIQYYLYLKKKVKAVY